MAQNFDTILEKKILSGIFYKTIEQKYLDKYSADDFSQEFYINLFKALTFLVDSNKVLDALLVRKYFNANNLSYSEDALNDVLSEMPIPHIQEYADELILLSQKRKLSKALYDAKEANDKGEKHPQTVLDDLTTVDIGDSNTRKIKNYNEWCVELRSKPCPPKQATGVGFIDQTLSGGMEMGQLVIIRGEQNSGKTSLIMQIIKYIIQNFMVLFYSLEFNMYKVLDKQGWEKLNAPLWEIIDDEDDIRSIEITITRKAKAGCRIFGIDSQMKIKGIAGRRDEAEESSKFKILAKLAARLNIIIIIIGQVSHDGKSFGSKIAEYEASLIITTRIPSKELQEYTQATMPLTSDGRPMYSYMYIEFEKNKQTGLHYKQLMRFKLSNQVFEARVNETAVMADLYFFKRAKKEALEKGHNYVAERKTVQQLLALNGGDNEDNTILSEDEHKIDFTHISM